MKDYTEIIDALRHCAEDGFDSCENCPYAAAPDSCAGLAKKAAEAIEELSAADVRPVVLCKDCMHSVQGKKSLECEKHRYVWNNMNRWVNDEDFCCWGVKREET